MSTIALDHRQTVRPAREARPVRHLSAVPDARSASAVHLTRRGKAVILVASLAVIAMLVVMFGSSTAATDQAGATQATHLVTVMPGHTLWEIAAEANPNGDIRKTVDDIIRLNSLPNASALQMGSEIAVPVYK